MALDTRVWSIFIFLITSALLLASISTPYYVKGVIVTFGEQGLWRVDHQLAGDRSLYHYSVTQILLVIAVVCAGLTLVGYVLLFRHITWAGQIISFVAQLFTGLFAIIAVSVFGVNDSTLAEGWWMAAMSGVLYLVNSVVILFSPMMEYDQQRQQALLSHAL